MINIFKIYIYIYIYIYKNRKKVIAFGDFKYEKHKLPYHKNSILLGDVDIDKTLISDNISCDKKGFKSFVGYKVYKCIWI